MAIYDDVIEERCEDENQPLIGYQTEDMKTRTKRDGAASAFAAFGLVWFITALQAFIRWVISPTEFGPAPILGPDEFPLWRLVSLRIFEALSVGVLLVHLWFCVLIPLFPRLKNKGFRNDGEPGAFSLDGRHVIGGLIALCADGFLNCQQYIFMWNSHSINVGVWSKFLPFHNHEASSRYAESLLWGPPMYVYFCAGFGILGCKIAKPIRERFPNLTNAGIFTIVWFIEFCLDFIIENLAIRITQGYGFSKTYGPLTLFRGKIYQFPIYESVFVASLGCIFTAVRLKAYDNGISPIERGYYNWHPKLHGLIRTFAVIGFCGAAVLFFYHLPLNWFGVIGDCYADIPSYMRPGPTK